MRCHVKNECNVYIPGIVLSSTHAKKAPKKLGFPSNINSTRSKSAFPVNIQAVYIIHSHSEDFSQTNA